jgi:hypothetical protein
VIRFFAVDFTRTVFVWYIAGENPSATIADSSSKRTFRVMVLENRWLNDSGECDGGKLSAATGFFLRCMIRFVRPTVRVARRLVWLTLKKVRKSSAMGIRNADSRKYALLQTGRNS